MENEEIAREHQLIFDLAKSNKRRIDNLEEEQKELYGCISKSACILIPLCLPFVFFFGGAVKAKVDAPTGTSTFLYVMYEELLGNGFQTLENGEDEYSRHKTN